MPSRRRTTNAAAVPASRLPVGTPQVTASRSPTGPSSSRSPERESQGDQEDALNIKHHGNERNASSSMPPPADSAPTMSTAEAKLERQRKRIEEAEALTAAPALDRQTQASRGKTKWQKFDLKADAAGDIGGVPVSEVRVNTFRAPSQSRGSSLTRSLSVLSHRTSETGGPSDMERQDSGFPDVGFQQVYKGRRSKKNFDELSAYEDKPEERQKTVEALTDTREIYNVFGNALPGPEYMEQHPGTKDGELKFFQHPNGDVSAHQWSTVRFIWENIGQFSNIRKKVEGQLASDRLKGETAYQTLQQNTLAYFRIIAKQREANVMGFPFGPKEIHAAIPEPPPELAAAPTGLKESVQDAGRSEQLQDKQVPYAWENQGYRNTLEQASRMQADQPPVTRVAAQNTHGTVPTGNHRPYNHPSYSRYGGKPEDPFYSGAGEWQHYGGYQHGHPYGYHNSYQPTAPTYHPSLQRSRGLDYDFNFPQVDAGARSAHPFATPGYAAHGAAPYQQYRGGRTANATAQGYPLYHNKAADMLGTTRSMLNDVASSSVKTATPQSKVATPLNTRVAMRDHLLKIGENAKERSLSQTNIRTVLYDPFQNQATKGKDEAEQDAAKKYDSSEFVRNVSGKTLQPPASLDISSTNYFPTILAPDVEPSVSSDGGANLLESDPDYSQTLLPDSTFSAVQSTSQIHNAESFAGGRGPRSALSGSTTGSTKRSPDEKLKSWWTSGNKFQRQEEFFQSIKASHGASGSTFSSPPAHLTPIGTRNTPRKQQPEVGFNESTTRLLIPILENLSSYVQGPLDQRRDYFSRWVQPPEWCIDRSENGNDSFYDKDWGQPPARIGRDPRYSTGRQSWASGQHQTPRRFGGGPVGSPTGVVGGERNSGIIKTVAAPAGIERRFAFGGRY